MVSSQVVKVKRDTLRPCMTCPLCHNFYKDATTISLCLHTFCRKCIYDKLSDEEMDCCPVCNIDLGCLPVEKLRPDHNLQDIRAKVFPFKRKKIKAQEVLSSISLPTKRKERSLSSLVVSAPKVSMQPGFTGKRTKTSTRKAAAALRGCSFLLEESIKKEETNGEDNMDPSMAEPSKKHKPNEDKENSVEHGEGKVDLWTPLNCLVEAANRTKSSRSNSQAIPLAKLESPFTPHGGQNIPEITTKTDLPASVHSELNIPKSKNKDTGHKTILGDDKDANSLPSGPVKRRRLRPAGQKRVAASEMSSSSPAPLNATGSKCNRKNSPIWFSLVASEDQKGDIPLPQISACYLRIKDGTVPVSFIQKYLVKKLNLSSEAEVEIMCRGQAVLPSLQLHNLVDLWFRTASTSKRIPASVGSSAKDFVMVLSYCRKTLPP
ncbi:E3 ubiquitin protein ligase DRIP2 isoform X1 [Vigna radiata var. radiata]|uniref:E3 ubiquitin protein ligase DRIP2 isoform X1 n=1 Tax=Vigna radiata var. radiata TaxID=3916 RepID=A0A1S3V8Y8_VIGRR|nr:E3 ubiquitin protein ligase DRIP2 isoform X1 [Vigna radiata var. radiata]